MTKQKDKKGADMTGLEGFQKKMEEKKTILERLKIIDVEKGGNSKALFVKKRELGQARQELDGYLREMRRNYSAGEIFNEKNLQLNQQKKLETYRSDITDAEKSQSEIEAVMKNLESEKNILQKRLADFSRYEITISDVLECQRKIANARKEVKDIADIIQNQKSLIAEANSTPSQINNLHEKKEDILAEIASGKDLKTALEKVSHDIDIETERIAAKKMMITDAEKALAGLNRKLMSAFKALEKIEGLKSEVLIQYFRCEAERVGKEYGDLSSSLVEKYHTLAALDVVITQCGGQTIKGEMNFDISVPAFRLNVFESLVVPDYPNVIAKARLARTRDNIEAAVTRERDRIARLGIKL